MYARQKQWQHGRLPEWMGWIREDAASGFCHGSASEPEINSQKSSETPKIARLDSTLCRLEAILQQTTDATNPSVHLPRKRVQKQLLDCMTQALELRIELATGPELQTEKAVLEQLVSNMAELLGIPTPDPFAED